jgi:hypothetical protein
MLQQDVVLQLRFFSAINGFATEKNDAHTVQFAL